VVQGECAQGNRREGGRGEGGGRRGAPQPHESCRCAWQLFVACLSLPLLRLRPSVLSARLLMPLLLAAALALDVRTPAHSRARANFGLRRASIYDV
jgi:hypothetical protein